MTKHNIRHTFAVIIPNTNDNNAMTNKLKLTITCTLVATIGLLGVVTEQSAVIVFSLQFVVAILGAMSVGKQ